MKLKVLSSSVFLVVSATGIIFALLEYLPSSWELAEGSVVFGSQPDPSTAHWAMFSVSAALVFFRLRRKHQGEIGGRLLRESRLDKSAESDSLAENGLVDPFVSSAQSNAGLMCSLDAARDTVSETSAA